MNENREEKNEAFRRMFNAAWKIERATNPNANIDSFRAGCAAFMDYTIVQRQKEKEYA